MTIGDDNRGASKLRPVIKDFAVLNIQDILRAQDVTRWGIINCSRRQSLAEHTFNVVALARDLANRLGVPDDKIIKYAFDHDLDEILTGDIPTPAKERLNIRDNYAGRSRDKCATIDVAIVSVCDLIEAIWYINVHGLGRKAANVVDNLTDRLNSRINLYSMTNPSFGDKVGELINDIEFGEYV